MSASSSHIEPGAHEGSPFLVFRVGDRRLALASDRVIRVLHAVEVSPLPSAPDVVRGVIDVRGELFPAIDLRRRFGMAVRELMPEDSMIVVRARHRVLVLIADSVEQLVSFAPAAVTPVETIFRDVQYIHGLARLDDEVLAISDIDAFLSIDEEDTLDAALGGSP